MESRKHLDEDCLLEGELHPSIAERLARVRELPVTSVANFHGVENDSDGTWMVWEHVPGVNLEQFILAPHSADELDRVFRDLKLAVSAMHSHGIVHGAIHPRNVIVDLHGKVRLTHVSPLLYSDPAVDERALEKLAGRVGDIASADAPGRTYSSIDERKHRRRAYLSALAALLAGIALFAAILWYIRG